MNSWTFYLPQRWYPVSQFFGGSVSVAGGLLNNTEQPVLKTVAVIRVETANIFNFLFISSTHNLLKFRIYYINKYQVLQIY